MSKTVIDIDYELLLKDLDSFKESLLPLINNNRIAAGERELTGEEEIVNCFLDLKNKHAGRNTALNK